MALKQKLRTVSFLLIGLLAAATGLVLFLPDPNPIPDDAVLVDADAYDVRILRDTWGVPHIFGKSDADAAFGLAYAHAEDDFLTIQNSLMAARGKLATLLGEEGAPNDYMVRLFKIWDFIDEKYESDLSPELRAVCQAYADGLNLYGSEHPKTLLAGVYPIRGQDVVAGFVHKTPLFFGTHTALKELFAENRQRSISGKSAGILLNGPPEKVTLGSNAIAVSPRRSANGETFLAINSHQPWVGPVAWYEAHVRSEEGWNISGGLFPGSPVILVGHTPDLGWCHTVNKPDLNDVYVLEMNPDNPNQYRFDGQWRDLEVQNIPVTVKILGRFKWTFNREGLWSVYGPTIRSEHGVYSIRFANYGDIRMLDQWFAMNKAGNFQEWQTAMKKHAIPMFNTVYADKTGNIFYVYNGALPERAEGYDWRQYLPGNTSETLWRDYRPYEELPQVLNPASGFVQSCNNSPFHTTSGPENPDSTAFSSVYGIESIMTNRAHRALELFGADSAITPADFHKYKYDMNYSPKSIVAGYIRQLSQVPTPNAPLLQRALAQLKVWDRGTDPENPHAALAVLAFSPYLERGRFRDNIGTDSLLTTLAAAARELQSIYGRLDVPWKTVNRLVRGELDLPCGGGPDVLHAVYHQPYQPGIRQGFAGDSYIAMVQWDAEGNLSSESLHQFGSATLDGKSAHYGDQAPLFVARKLKPVWFDESDIRANLEREYRPGK